MNVLITGASSGLGEALALRIAHRYPQARLGLLARRESELRSLADRIGPGRCQILVCDLLEPGAARAAAAAFLAETGVPDWIVANAGISAGTVTGESDDDAVFARIVQLNLLAMMQTFSPFMAPMKARGSGRLVGVASVAGIRGLPGAGAYSASKAGAIAYLESLRLECRGSGVRVVTLAPGYIRTPMTARNPYPMPFLMSADAFAQRAVESIARGHAYRVIPWQMGWVARVLRVLPIALYDRVFARAPRKPRQNPTDR
ncbi:MAG: SDR family oxidoreductase [Burkholderiaceae bacterium]